MPKTQISSDAVVLGIETSCDETSLALYHGHDGLLGQVLHSQTDVHKQYGGVVPELAARDHARRLEPLLQELFDQCHCQPSDVDLIAYTAGPGLAGALMTGVVFARSLAFILRRPCLGLHHMEAHLLSVNLDSEPPPEPFVSLLVSGGHTLLALVESVGCYRILGTSLDDACGEAFDKVAKLLGLGYPGGPALSALATSGRDGACNFSRPMSGRQTLDMSFSGLKTQVLREVQSRVAALAAKGSTGVLTNGLPDHSLLDKNSKADIARAFEECVVDVLTDRAKRALAMTGCQSLVVAGGVGANSPLRESLARAVTEGGQRLYIPPVQYCTDNAAMVAYLGWHRRHQAEAACQDGREPLVRPRWPIDSLQPPPQPGC